MISAEAAPAGSREDRPSLRQPFPRRTAASPRCRVSSAAAVAGDAEPPEARVRSIFPSRLEPADADGRLRRRPARFDRAAGRIAGPSHARSIAEHEGRQDAKSSLPRHSDSGPREGGPADDNGAAAAREPALRLSESPRAIARQPFRALEPLPSADEWQVSSPRKPPRRTPRWPRSRSFWPIECVFVDTRIGFRFHEELRQILESDSRTAGAEIDALVKRDRGDRDPKTYAKARSIWRYVRNADRHEGESDSINGYSRVRHSQLHVGQPLCPDACARRAARRQRGSRAGGAAAARVVRFRTRPMTRHAASGPSTHAQAARTPAMSPSLKLAVPAPIERFDLSPQSRIGSCVNSTAGSIVCLSLCLLVPGPGSLMTPSSQTAPSSSTEGDKLADEGKFTEAVIRYKSGMEKLLPNLRKIPFKHEVKRDVTKRENMKELDSQGNR